MLTSLKNRLARWTGAGARPAGARRAAIATDPRGAASPPTREEDVVDALPDGNAAEAPQPDDAATHIRRALAHGTHALRSRYADEINEGDGRALLASLGEEGSVLVKQPPIAAQAVLSVIQRRDCSLAQLSRVVERDPALLQDLLRHANSAFYANPKPVTSVAMAVQRIGTSGVYATVMARIVEGQFTKPGSGLDRMAVMVWEHLVRTAPIARALARTFGVDPEEAYTLGLLHDVGKLILFDRIADLRRRRRREVELPDGFVRDALALLHAPIGATACSTWGLSEDFLRGMVHHHRSAPTQTPSPLSEVAFLAERADIAAQRGEPLDLPALWEQGRLSARLDEAAEVLAALVEAADDGDEPGDDPAALEPGAA